MNRWVLPSRRLVFVCSVIFLSFLVLNLPLLAAGPAPVQNGPSGPRIWLQENQPLPVQHIPVALSNGQGMAVADSSALSGMGQGQPVSMASADLDADGFDDLLVGYSAGAGGFISIHRGNIDAFAPQSDASFQAIGRGQFPSPFLLEARTFSVPVSPDFMALGDFTGSGNRDLAVASKGGSALYIFPGDGKGNFAAPQTVNLAGGVSSLAAGELGHTPVLIVGTSRSLMVYVYSPQGLTALASYPLAAPASNILFGDFGDPGLDVAFLSGGKIQILRSSTMQVATVSLPVTVQAFALGTFIYDRSYGQQIALVAPDGSIKFAARNEFDPRVYSVAEFQAIRQAKMNRQPAPAFVPVPSFPANGWKIVESFPGAAALGANQAPLIFRTRISINGADDVMVLNAFSGQLSLVSHGDGQPGAQTFQSGQVSLRPYSGTPIAALPMRLNVDGRLGVMAIHSNEVAPSLMVPIPDPTFFVNKDTDTAPTSPIANACNNTSFADVSSSCSLREAVLKANGDTIMLQAGHTYSLTIGRGATQDYSGNTGALYVNHTATIVGGNQNTTVIQWGTPGTGTADMVMAVNEDVTTTTTATASLSNLTIQNGVNHGASGLDGDGGCMEFDTGTNGTATLSLTNVTLQNCSTLQGGGGGIVIFNFVTPAGAGGVTISNSIIQGNSVVNTGSAGIGGGIAINFDAHMTMTASQVLNNSAVQNCTPTCGLGAGGGIIGFAPQSVSAATGESFIHSSTISGNQAAGFGGGINTSASISIDQGTVISGNTAGTDGSNPTAHASQEGGGLYLNPAASCPLSSTCTATLGKLTITGNKATGNGGGISYGNGSAGTVGALSMSFSRLAGNTTSGGSGSNLSNNHGTATVTDNWWGTNNPATTINSISATTTLDPFIVLTHRTVTPTDPQKIRINQSTTLTGDMSADNHGVAVGLANLTEIIGLPITFDSPVLGTIPQAQPETLNGNAQATATFNAGGTSGFGTANATVDQAVVPVNSNLISSATETGTTATITTVGAHGYTANEFVRISGVGVTGYNSSPATQVFTILSTPTPTTFTYTANAAGLGSSSGGTANAGIVILEPPSIAKKFSPATIQTTAGAGTTVSTITFTIQNQNVVPIDASFTDNLPTNVGVSPGSLVVATTPTVVNNCGGTVTATAGAGSISFSNTTLPVGACTIQVNVQSAVDNIYSNSVTIDSTDAGNGNTSSDTLNVINPPHITKSFGVSSIPFGATTSLTITVSNPNQNQTLSDISFTDTLPNNAPGTLVVASPSGLNSTCTGTASGSAGSGAVSLNSASLAPGASCTVSVNVQGTKVGAANNSVTASDATAGTGNTGTASETVVKADTTTTVTSSVNPSVFSQSVTFTATVSPVAPGAGTPTGTVTFLDGGSPVGSGTIIGGIATFTTSALAVGNHTITTNYGGDGNFNGSTGSLTGNPQVVNKADTATTVTSSVNPSVFGQSATFTAVVSPVAPGSGTPTGTVTFLDGGSPIGTGTLIGGVATFTTSALSVGNHTITTSYGGDGNFNGSTGSLTGNPQVVNKADTATTVTSSQNPQTAGQPVTFTATVSAVAPGSGTPTGTVTFLDGGSPIGSGTLIGGVATFTTSALAPGSHTITTNYGGDGNFNGSTGSLTGNPQVITQASTTTTVTSSAGTITLGNTVTFTATVTAASGTATGLVTFFDGNTPIGSAPLNGTPGNDQATFPTSLLSAVGSPHSITAIYQGATAFAGSTSAPITETVNPRTSTTGIVLNPTTVVVGQSSTATVTVTDSGPVPPGTADTFQATGAPVTGRTGFTATLIADGAVLITGGTDANNNVLNSAEVYAGGTFSATPGNLNTARTGAVAVLLPNARVLIAGGSSDGTANGALNTAELLDPNTGTFALTSHNLTAARFGATITLLNTGKVLISGGVNSGGVLNSAELYDPATDTFTATGNLNAARTGASATLLGTGKVLVAGGSSDGTANGALNSAELFDPAGNAGAGTFTAVAGSTPTLAAGRWQPEAALLLSGKVLVAGGQNSGGALTSADLYDPVADSFTPSNHSMAQARANGSAVALPSGTVLLAGGTTSQAVDLYDADSDKFNTTGSLQQSDSGLVSTLLNNGQVLVVGLTTAASPASDAELYSPSFNPLGTVAVTSSEATDSITGACTLTTSTSTASTCTSTVTPQNVATSPHTITGTYPADAVHSGSNNTASLTVNPDSTTTTVLSSSNPSAFGQSVTFTATVTDSSAGSTAQPTGSVQFVVDGVNFGSPVALTGASSNSSTATSAATATLSVAGSPHSVTANYVNADGNFSNSTGSLTPGQTVTAASTSTAVVSSSNPSAFGQSVTFTATVTDISAGSTAQPAGSVQFVVDGVNFGSPVTLVGASSTSSTATSAATATLSVAGSPHSVTANYVNADGNFSNSTGALTGGQTVTAANTTTAVTSSLNPSALGQSVTFTATVSPVAPGTGTPTGTVTFLDGGSPIGTGTLSGGGATFTTSALAAGSHTIHANYGGDGNFNVSTGSVTQVVVAPPQIAKAFNPVGIQPNGVSTMTITITNPAANTVAEAGVAFADNFPANLVVATPNGLSTACSDGSSLGGTPTATAGSGTVSLTGGTVNQGASCTLTVNVTSAFTGSYLNSTGSVSSTNGGTGNAASATLSVANPPTISKLFLPNTTSQNVPVLLSFTISNPNSNSTAPNNDVTLTGISFTDALPAGLQVAATPNASSDCGGTLTAVAGSTSVTLTGGAIAQAVGLISTRGHRTSRPVKGLALSIANGACFISVSVTPTVTGTLNNTTGPISANESGPGATSNTASLTVTAAPAVVAPTLTKAFSPSDVALGQTTTLSFTVTNPNSSTTLVNTAFTDPLPNGLVVASPNGLTGTCVTNFGASVAANPGSGLILLSMNLPASTSCSFSVNVTPNSGGTKNNVTGNITASFDDGSGNFQTVTGGTANATLTIEQPALSITKTHQGNFSRGQSGATYTITVSVGGTGHSVGTVTVTDTLPNVNNTLVATNIAGSGWTCTLATLTCTRSDALASGSSYPPITLTVNVPQNIRANVTNSATVSGGGDPNSHTANDPTHIGPPVQISIGVSNVTVNVGGTQFVTLTVDSTAGEGTLNLSCSGLPFGSTCSFNPPSTNQLSTTVTMGITTSPGAGSVLPLGTGRTPPLYAAVLPLLGLMIGFGLRKKGKLARMRLAFAFSGLALFLALMGCGGTRTTPPTPASTSQVTVTATSTTTGDSGSATITLTVP